MAWTLFNAAGWPYMNGNYPVYKTPEYTQVVADLLAETVGEAPAPIDRPLDSGWVDCTVLSPFNHRAIDYRPQVRRTRDNLVFFRGQMSNTNIPEGGSHAIIQVPVGFWPAFETRWMGFVTAKASTPFGGWVRVDDGKIYIQTADNGAPTNHFTINIPPWEPAP